MGKLRLSEKWFQRGLWLIAVLFAAFLIGLGRLVVQDLPNVVPPRDVESYMAPDKTAELQALLQKDQASLNANQVLLDDANGKLAKAQKESEDAHETYDNWIETRKATGQSQQDAEVLKRTRQLDDLKAKEQKCQDVVDGITQQRAELQKPQSEHQAEHDKLYADAQVLYDHQMRIVELKVFLMRLAFTLPLLLLAVLLYMKARKSSQWPFVWGFIFFALYVFFVELVPYLPSYGGYVRYAVGVVLTLLIGNYAIRALRRYLERQKAVEEKPELERRKSLGADVAQVRLAKKVCPGCERPFDTSDPQNNFCMYCGLVVFVNCPHCNARQTAFSQYCRTCGAERGDVSQASTSGVAES